MTKKKQIILLNYLEEIKYLASIYSTSNIIIFEIPTQILFSKVSTGGPCRLGKIGQRKLCKNNIEFGKIYSNYEKLHMRGSSVINYLSGYICLHNSVPT